MELSTKAQLLLKIRQTIGSRSIITFNRTQSISSFIKVLSNPEGNPTSIAKAAAKDVNLATSVLNLANQTRRDISTAPITELEKAVVRIGRLGCSEALIRLEQVFLEEKCLESWLQTFIAMQRLMTAATKMAKRRAISNGVSLVDTVFLTTLNGAGILSQVYAASEMALLPTAENKRLVISPDRDVTTLTLHAMKLPTDVIARVMNIGLDSGDTEGVIAHEVWKLIDERLQAI